MKRSCCLILLGLLVSCDGGDSDRSPNGAGMSRHEGERVSLTAADGVTVYGTFRQAEQDDDRVVLLFHQAGSNRHEYDPVAPRLNDLGWDTLAVDQRSGGQMWGHQNRTVGALGQSTEYRQAMPDLQAAVDWAAKRGYESVVTVGSSYSAALNFLLARENKDKLTAIACFSPGEYLGEDDLVKNAAAEVDIPVYVTAGASEEEQQRVDEVLSKADSEKVTRYKPTSGVHGASTLRADKNPGGAEENFSRFADFLSDL